LGFRWHSQGLKPLDAVFGPVLTIEGRDAQGAQRAWYVRLWNYAQGSPEDARITLRFDQLDGGFLLPAEADPVWAGDVDRMFVSLVAPAYDGTPARLAAPAEATVWMEDIHCDGGGAILKLGDAFLPEHRLRIATAYDDSYDLTPERLLRTALHLGYRGILNHYVGMSHYARLAWDPGEGALRAQPGTDPLNAPCAAW
ncbi:MAG: TIGR02217 family protein, partial [Sphingomonadaceae bacterium]